MFLHLQCTHNCHCFKQQIVGCSTDQGSYHRCLEFAFGITVTEYPNLEGTCKDHQVQPLAPQGITLTQTLCLREQCPNTPRAAAAQGCVHCPGQPAPCPLPSVVDPFPNHQLAALPLTAPCCSLRPCCCPQRAELSAAPPLPVRSCSRHEVSPQLFCSGLSTPRGLSHSSHTVPSDPSPSLLPATRLSNSFMSILCSGTQTCTQCWR